LSTTAFCDNLNHMDTQYDHKKLEPKMMGKWERLGAFTAKRDPKKKPYTIVLPPPNANGKLHMGHVLMCAIEDVLIRWKKMQGFSTLWVPGTDHAGFETQVVFEKELKKQDKSRFDFDRDTLYKMIWDFVEDNKHVIEEQIKSMGSSLDWSRYTFTLDQKVIDTVYKTFSKMIDDGLVYRDDYIVNYCPKCGTTFADLEIKHEERKSNLYYIKYGPLTVATTRPETKFGDVALAVNPKDKRYKDYVGKTIEFDDLLGRNSLPIIADSYIDPDFGTGVLKITPAHDKNDYDIGKKHKLAIKSVIGLDGKLTALAGKYAGLSVFKGREAVVRDLKEMGLLEKVDENYQNSVTVCYKGNHEIEPTIMPNWFVKVEPLKKPALEAVKKGKVKIYPKWQEITYVRWMEEMRDWPISRQVVWGIRIPAWYDTKENPDMLVSFLDKAGKNVIGIISELLGKHSFEEIEKGLQSLIVPKEAKFIISAKKPSGGNYLQETDTFDTWYSSGHWPLVTLGYPDSEDFKYFYPTAVLETGWEIIRFWVSRMIMFGIYLTGKPPFSDVYLHGLVRAVDGKKMSKSLGNVVDPLDYIPQYGADALRMGLISGTANGKDFAFPKDKILAYRNFANKIWNMARFSMLIEEDIKKEGKEVLDFDSLDKNKLLPEDKELLKTLEGLVVSVTTNLEKYRFSDAADGIYQFMWHEVADKYIEAIKNRNDKEIALSVFGHVFRTGLKLLHPFMPFITEAIWEDLPKNSSESKDLVNADWPADK
jgi:valyl-tRNA synthetase